MSLNVLLLGPIKFMNIGRSGVKEGFFFRPFFIVNMICIMITITNCSTNLIIKYQLFVKPSKFCETLRYLQIQESKNYIKNSEWEKSLLMCVLPFFFAKCEFHYEGRRNKSLIQASLTERERDCP